MGSARTTAIRGGALRGRIRGAFDSSRALVRLVYRDPENVPERLTLKAVERLGEPAREWARRQASTDSVADRARACAELRRHTAQAARIDGAIAGTPFFIALVPGYLAFLWLEAAMVLRTAALYGRDPREHQAAAELLALRGIHASVDAALDAVRGVAATPIPDKPAARRPVRTWVRSVRMVLVLGGFLNPPKDAKAPEPRARPLAVLAVLAGVGIWAVTWVFPLTFMIAMAWSCERDARDLGRRAATFYGGEAAAMPDRQHRERRLLRSLALFLSIALPIAFVAYADRVRNTTGLNWVAAIGALVALSLVIATAVLAQRR